MSVNLKTKTRDMEAGIKKLGWDIADLKLKLSLTEITESFFRQEVRKLAEDYANLKVIEELELLIKGIDPDGFVKVLVIRRIKELKSEL
tara:strand:- start:191 stop:457 length:267 start_codon:yes stop_codon:yes gene_type:complete